MVEGQRFSEGERFPLLGSVVVWEWCAGDVARGGRRGVGGCVRLQVDEVVATLIQTFRGSECEVRCGLQVTFDWE